MLYAKLNKGDTLKAVMDKVIQIINLVHACSLHHHQFVELMEQIETEYEDLVMHTEVQWLPCGEVLDLFLALLPEIKGFLAQKFQMHAKSENKNGILAFIITGHLKVLNETLQGGGKNTACSY